jgi:hypothetical protein
MIARLLIMLALLLGTLPVPSQAAAPCHASEAAPAGMMAMAHHDAVPMSSNESGGARDLREMLCIGCIAPTTLRGAPVAPPARMVRIDAIAFAPLSLSSIGGKPEPPPPRR